MQTGRRFGGMSRPRDAAAICLAVATTLLLLASLQLYPLAPLFAQQLPSTSGIAGRIGEIPHGTATMSPPQVVASAFMPAPEPLTAGQVDMSRLEVDNLTTTWSARRAGAILADPSAGPTPGTEARPRDLGTPGAAARFLQRVIPLTPSAFGLAVRMVAEPSVAVGESAIWFTGNWFAARSIDQGATWTYVNPYADFPTFTSDQDTVYDPHRRLFLWYRQGGLVPGRLENSFKLNISRDGAASWCGYTVRPTDIDASWTTLDFDYPHLALSDNYLYISSTLLVTGAGFATPRMILLRMSLDDLAGCSTFRYDHWTADEGWSWTPVENGASAIMYLGDTLDPGGTNQTGTFRLYWQPELTTGLFYVDRAVPAWSFTERSGLCPVSGGGNPCARSDQRVTSGWVRQRGGRGEIGFLWNVREGGGFLYPYVDAVTFDEETLNVTGRPMLWDNRCAWQYGAAAPNGEELGITAFYFCPSQPPAHVVGVGDASSPSKWATFYSRAGDVPTATQIWGDYVRVRPDGRGFVATGYTIGENGAVPFLVAFARNPLAQPQDIPEIPDFSFRR